MIRVDALERQREPVRIALAPDFAVGDDVDAGALHVPDRHHRRIVLRLFEKIVRYPPKLGRVHPRHAAAPQRLAIDKPVRLGIAANDRRRDEMGGVSHYLTPTGWRTGARMKSKFAVQ